MDFSTDKEELNILNQITIRIIDEEGKDRDRFDELLRTKHYLKSDRIGGRHIRYVAEVQGEWVAMASFSGASPHTKPRENWIGWSRKQKTARLGMVVNNSRFLMLTERNKVPNMASKVLSLCLKRIRDDWKKRWGASILIVESFVDETLYPGTCYKACGFEKVGMTAGYEKSSRDFYVEHGQPKQLYLRELYPGARKILKREKLPKELASEEVELNDASPNPIEAKQLRSLLECFQSMEEPRSGHGLHHRMHSTLACAAVAMLMGEGTYQGFEDMCGKLSQHHLRILRCHRDKDTGRYIAPSDSTFYRIFRLVDPKEFERIIAEWLLKQEPKAIQRLAVDGKVLRGSSKGKSKPLSLLSVVTHHLRLTLNSVPIEEKSNEIPAIKPLLQDLKLEGSIITADAMHCQRESAKLITQQLGGDYLFGLKGNQDSVLERAKIKLSSVPFTFEEDTLKKTSSC